ncbi:hypothetical protein NUU61_005663 [Penicillium alfredii]|uniref:INO80 complex subunit Ies4 n=1 Tax=Penicillium alfredii TaxID=1506179 RepID=A0A9W9FAB4_9EURO|nr:uncharacterized protein NUU61_005663 [Penicillium alfredii]KAJ5096307.1 hypothetical protein NUU61_005663 [Penicillium alfredii]
MPAAGPGNGRSKGPKNNANNSMVVVLKVSAHALQQFGSHDTKNTPQHRVDTKNPERSSPASSAEAPAARPSSAGNGSDADANSTPATGATPADTPRRKGVPGPKPGNKRANGQTEPGARSRGRPGPKKRPRLEEGADASKLPAGQRLGPKANTGAINAGLRALDRTGAPCRKWERKPLQLRSFTGVLWQLPAWHSFRSSKLEEPVNGKVAALESGDSDTKPTLAPPGPDTVNGSSVVTSEKSNSGDGDVTPGPSNPIEPSSPAIAMAA